MELKQDSMQVWNTLGPSGTIPRFPGDREPNWHRKERQIRANARTELAAFVRAPRVDKADRACYLIQLLEAHHSSPKLVRARRALRSCGMSWQGAGWKGGYWKGARTPQRKKTEQNKKSDQAKEQKIPQYDSDCWVVGTSASSSSRPSESAGNLQDLTKVLKTVVKAGNFELPAEAMALLESSERDDTRAAFSTEQRALNARRKAFNKVQRLKDAMGKKTEKYRSFRQAIKDQLATETERYERDMEDIKKNLKLAEAELEKIESGVVDEEMASTTPANEDMDIFGAMDLVKEKDRLQAQLRLAQENSDAKEAKYMETQRNLQHQIQAMQQQMQSMLDHGMVVPTGTRSHVWPAISPVSSQELPGVSSPQMPTVRGAVRPFSRSRDRAEPYLVDNKEMKETTSTGKCRTEAKDGGLGNLE
eukprot:symbB.v1.2.028519.t1/scaffold3022.1/size65113/4